jgi:dTDP-L-rhamnose 4-epimerase
MKVFVTGGAGFIGKWLAAKLPHDIDLVILDSLDEQVHKLHTDFPQELKERARCIKSDVQDIEAHRDIIEGSDVIVHLASLTGTGQSMYEISKYVQHNANGTAKLMELISSLQKKPQRIVLTSSRAVYGEGAYSDGEYEYYPKSRHLSDLQKGVWQVHNPQGTPLHPLPMRETQLLNPTSLYGLSKLWQEQLLRMFCKTQDIDLVVLRLQNVYGQKQELNNPYTGIIGIFTNFIIQEKSVELFEDGLMTRDFVFVEDVANVICKCVCHELPLSTTVDVGSLLPCMNLSALLVRLLARNSVQSTFLEDLEWEIFVMLFRI